MGLALRGMLAATVPLTCVACECAGASTFSEQSPPVTTGLIDPPGAVSELQATALSAGSVRLDWESPTDSGGLPVIGHLVRRGRQDNMASSDMVSIGFGGLSCGSTATNVLSIDGRVYRERWWHAWQIVAGPDTSLAIGALLPGSTYQFAVRPALRCRAPGAASALTLNHVPPPRLLPSRKLGLAPSLQPRRHYISTCGMVRRHVACGCGCVTIA